MYRGVSMKGWMIAKMFTNHNRKYLGLAGFAGFAGFLYFPTKKVEILGAFVFFMFFSFYFAEKLSELSLNDQIREQLKKINEKINAIPILALLLICLNFGKNRAFTVVIAALGISLPFLCGSLVSYFYAKYKIFEK